MSSFSFKTGPPCSSNVVTDVRFLPDPKALEQDYPYITGRHPVVEDFLRGHHEFQPFFDELCASTSRVMRDLTRRGCQRITLAFGCTAGKHRSVFVAEALAEWLRANHGGVNVKVQHQDMPCEEDEVMSGSSTSSSAEYEAASNDVDSEMVEQGEHEPANSSGQQDGWHAGPLIQCTYVVEEKKFEFSEGSKRVPCSSMMNGILANGLDNFNKIRRQRRAKSGGGEDDYVSHGSHKVRRMGFDVIKQPHSL